ncbi:hypothetical protein CK203_055425 [Vitis vinifera]|uniref:Putative plant transposon protein domain-containing protein n=1 Tax=Vitis vinifera TaxID=29760 RepID=A0A438HMT4_VITVI|nr:hypothetical protein CK203_055425 [Vitis vinifera]
MHSEFEMSMMGELNFFLGLQIKQLKEGTFINQEKYIRDLPKRFNIEESKTMKTPMSSSIKLDKDGKGPRASNLGRLLLCPHVIASFSTFPMHLGFQVCVLLSLLASSSLFRSFSWLLRERRLPLGHKASALLSRLSLLRRRLAERQGRSINFSQLQHFGFEGLFGWMGWLPIIISTVRGVEIQLDPESICHILDIAPVGLMAMGKLSAHSLTVISQVLHHMICSILLPQGGHQDEVSYLEAFLVNSILTGRRIHVGYLMMMRMISCYESTTRVLPYGRFLTRVFKDVKVHPRVEEEAEIQEMEGVLNPQRGFKHRKPEIDIPPLQSEGVHFEASFPEPMMSELTYTVVPSSQPSFTKLPYTEPSPHQAPHAPDHAPWISTRISSLGTRMEELIVVSDTRF